LRGLATKYITLYSNNGTTTTQSVGANGGNGPPNWKYTFSATYDLDPISVNLSGRGITSGTYSNTTIGCTSGCPAITATTLTQNINYLPGNFYWDTAITYKFAHMDDSGYDAEAFFSVRNITNKDPAIVAQGTSGVAFSTPPCNAGLYDCLGRTFKAGVRFKLGAAAPMKKAEAAPMAAAPAPPPPPARPAPAAPPAPPVVPQKFLVFFDFDRANVRADAQKIVAQAADYAKKGGKAVIMVTGHTDTAGTDAYNLALSERRAKAVQAELAKLGFNANQIQVSFKGESAPLVATGDGVREPQNRRVEIVMP
jgi:outer membrane protein OmpA-like peptidoglycan-associated protein